MLTLPWELLVVSAVDAPAIFMSGVKWCTGTTGIEHECLTISVRSAIIHCNRGCLRIVCGNNTEVYKRVRLHRLTTESDEVD